MNDNKNYYKILGLPKGSSQEEIKSKFRLLALEYHPDRNKDPKAPDKFKEINEAYQVLSDPNKRADYDKFGRVGGGASGRGFEGSDPFSGFGDIFDTFFGGVGTRSGKVPQRGGDVQTSSNLSFEDAIFGSEKDIEIKRVEPCSHCNGEASEPGNPPITCSSCNGNGQVRRVQQSIFGQFSQVSSCPQCKGQGKTITHPCTHCKGLGRERRDRKIRVKMPAGIENAMQVRLTGEGHSGSNGGPPGNLYVEVNVTPHKIFQRHDTDILYELPINFTEAALGTTLEVPTLEAPENLKIPAGTQAGTIFRIKGHGVPYNSRTKRGDQLVIINVVTPRSLNKHQKELLEELSGTLDPASREGKGWLEKIKDSLSMD
jgi:molecular chaperone DnaJ